MVLVGDSGTGKTSLLKRCVEHQFSTDVLPTAGLDFQWKKAAGTEGQQGEVGLECLVAGAGWT